MAGKCEWCGAELGESGAVCPSCGYPRLVVRVAVPIPGLSGSGERRQQERRRRGGDEPGERARREIGLLGIRERFALALELLAGCAAEWNYERPRVAKDLGYLIDTLRGFGRGSL